MGYKTIFKTHMRSEGASSVGNETEPSEEATEIFFIASWADSKCKNWGIAMSQSMFVAHFSFADSCCFLCAISGVDYYAIAAFDCKSHISIPELIPIADFSFVLPFMMLH